MATVAQLSQSLSTAVSTAYPGATHVNVSIEDAVPAPRFGTGVLVRMTVSAILSNGVYYANTFACVAQNYGLLDEVAGWLERTPPILAEATPPAKIATEAQVQTAINAALPGGGTNENRIVNQQITIHPTFAVVSGLFPVGTTREQRTYVLYKKDPAGGLTLQNTAYNRLVGETLNPES